MVLDDPRGELFRFHQDLESVLLTDANIQYLVCVRQKLILFGLYFFNSRGMSRDEE